MTSRNKTVFVLGAGFSMDAGAPSQAKIIENIYKLRDRLETKKNAKAKPWLKMMDSFLTEQLLVSDNQKPFYALEDIYTPIDKSLTEMVSFRDYTPKDLLELRDALNRLVILAIREAITESSK